MFHSHLKTKAAPKQNRWLAAGVLIGFLSFTLLSLNGCSGSGPTSQNTPIKQEQKAQEMPVHEALFQPHASIKPMKLRIPMGYIPDMVGWWEPYMPEGVKRPGPGEIEETIWLFATWPEMQPKTQENQHRFSDRAQTRGTILFSSIRGNTAFQLQDEMELRFQIRRESISRIDGVGHLIAYPPRYGLDVEGLPVELIKKRARPWDMPVDSYDQVLTRKDASGNVTTFLKCTFDYVPDPEELPNPEKANVRPQCEHFFIHHELKAIVSMGYRRKYLPQWQELEARARTVLSSFIVQQS
jgi:hypothetical protein